MAKQTKAATDTLVLNEELTRILIDQQLQDAGWEADSQDITFQKGARPEKGHYRAIAEWPTNHNGEKGKADYVLFAGLTPIAVVEAKKENTNVAGKIRQAERYSKGFKVEAPLVGAWELIPATAGPMYRNWRSSPAPGSGMCANPATCAAHCRSSTRRAACWICWNGTRKTLKNC